MARRQVRRERERERQRASEREREAEEGGGGIAGAGAWLRPPLGAWPRQHATTPEGRGRKTRWRLRRPIQAHRGTLPLQGGEGSRPRPGWCAAMPGGGGTEEGAATAGDRTEVWPRQCSVALPIRESSGEWEGEMEGKRRH